MKAGDFHKDWPVSSLSLREQRAILGEGRTGMGRGQDTLQSSGENLEANHQATRCAQLTKTKVTAFTKGPWAKPRPNSWGIVSGLKFRGTSAISNPSQDFFIFFLEQDFELHPVWYSGLTPCSVLGDYYRGRLGGLALQWQGRTVACKQSA